MDFFGKIGMEMVMQNMEVEVQMDGNVDYADIRHFRENVNLHLDLSHLELGPGMPQEPLALTVRAVANGDKLFVEPVFQDDWLLNTVKESGIGIEKMTFTLNLDLMEEMLKVYWSFLEKSDIDFSTFLPDGVDMEEFLEQGINPSTWARMYLVTADITEFRVDSNEVHIKAKLKNGWPQGFEYGNDPQTAAMMQDMEYAMSFDRFTGFPTSMNMDMSMEGIMNMTFSLEFQNFVVQENLFPDNHFQFEAAKDRNLFPIDTFVQMALGSMQGQMQEDDDIPF